MPEDIQAWFASKIPRGWFTGPPEVIADGEEILVIGALPDAQLSAGPSQEAREAARPPRIRRFREQTRDTPAKLARAPEQHLRRQQGAGAAARDLTRAS